MIVADTITALCMGVIIALFATGRVQLWHVYTLMFVRSTMQTFQSPAAAASTSRLVPAEKLTHAAGLNQTVQGLMSIAAAPLGAVALAWLPLQGALAIDGVTAILGIVPLLIYRIPQTYAARETRMSLWQEFRAGTSVVLRHRRRVPAGVLLRQFDADRRGARGTPGGNAPTDGRQPSMRVVQHGPIASSTTSNVASDEKNCL